MQIIKNKIKEIIILVLVVIAEFFLIRNYRNEIIINQVQAIGQLQQTVNNQQAVLNETNKLLNQVNWNDKGMELWKKLGYKFEGK